MLASRAQLFKHYILQNISNTFQKTNLKNSFVGTAISFKSSLPDMYHQDSLPVTAFLNSHCLSCAINNSYPAFCQSLLQLFSFFFQTSKSSPMILSLAFCISLLVFLVSNLVHFTTLPLSILLVVQSIFSSFLTTPYFIGIIFSSFYFLMIQFYQAYITAQKTVY